MRTGGLVTTRSGGPVAPGAARRGRCGVGARARPWAGTPRPPCKSG